MRRRAAAPPLPAAPRRIVQSARHQRSGGTMAGPLLPLDSRAQKEFSVVKSSVTGRFLEAYRRCVPARQRRALGVFATVFVLMSVV